MARGKKAALIILDGWGYGPNDPKVNAIAASETPVFDSLREKYPNSTLVTWGEEVGLPEGQMGNSEVGHLNIGAGRVVYQQLLRINRAFERKEAAENPVLKEAFQQAREKGKVVHLIGLVSNGGVHSSLEHLKHLLTLAKEQGVERVFVHAFTDGRDTDPYSGAGFLQELEEHMQQTTGRIASVIGRYYGMDRDKRWERIKMAYDLLLHGKGRPATSAVEAVKASYEKGVTDEFIKPIAIQERNHSVGTICEGDVVINFNFRTDRGRQITMALTQQDFPEFQMKRQQLHYITFTEYDATFQNVKVVFENKNLENTMGEVLAKAGKTQLRMAETEKYPHVTFFFSGGREEPFEGEMRKVIPSPKVATYDLQPEMSAPEVAKEAVRLVQEEMPDFLCLNFANPDMVGHTGVFEAVVKAVETTDRCLGQVLEALLEKDYAVIVTADHGNADMVVNEDSSPNTAHTKNPVPVILVNTQAEAVKPGKLGDLAPTLLKLLGVAIPEEMTGEPLV